MVVVRDMLKGLKREVATKSSESGPLNLIRIMRHGSSQSFLMICIHAYKCLFRRADFSVVESPDCDGSERADSSAARGRYLRKVSIYTSRSGAISHIHSFSWKPCARLNLTSGGCRARSDCFSTRVWPTREWTARMCEEGNERFPCRGFEADFCWIDVLLSHAGPGTWDGFVVVVRCGVGVEMGVWRFAGPRKTM